MPEVTDSALRVLAPVSVPGCGVASTCRCCILPADQVSEYGAGSALRVLALAYRPWASEQLDVAPADESGLVFVGMVGMQVRPPLLPPVYPAAALRAVVPAGERKTPCLWALWACR